MTTIDPSINTHVNGARDTERPEPELHTLQERAAELMREFDETIANYRQEAQECLERAERLEAQRASFVTGRPASSLVPLTWVDPEFAGTTIGMALSARDGAPASKPKRARKHAKAKAREYRNGPAKAAAQKPGSVAGRVMFVLQGTSGETGKAIADTLGLPPVSIQSTLHALLKAGKVKHKGDRRARVWSVA